MVRARDSAHPTALANQAAAVRKAQKIACPYSSHFSKYGISFFQARHSLLQLLVYSNSLWIMHVINQPDILVIAQTISDDGGQRVCNLQSNVQWLKREWFVHLSCMGAIGFVTCMPMWSICTAQYCCIQIKTHVCDESTDMRMCICYSGKESLLNTYYMYSLNAMYITEARY